MKAAQHDVVDALRLALKERDRLRRDNERLLGTSSEPIAIVGMACRYPGGAGSPQALWELVAAGEDGISAFPEDRGWDLERLYDPDPDAPGTSYAREGGFLVDADRFDAAFFGIGPREALATDPQQRLLLEAAWEALEQAGIDPSSLRGEPAGVFSGISSSDYAPTLRHAPELEGHASTGNLGSVLSGRIAYQLGLEGPAITVDTACSSSLVAMHLAAGSLRSGECSLALAGGVTVLSTPGAFVEFSRQRGLAPDGRCKSFAEAADGTGFSEGVGLLVLERLSEAQRNGHQVLATIKGSAVNQDGASNGLTAPNGPSQERVIRQALANAGLKPQDVDMVEAHGTGTTLGDPIEAGALLATYGQEREAPLKLGSIKSNIGHTQAAAGVAGVIKAVMAMREGILPKTLHAAEPSTKVEWEAGEIELLSEACPWQPNGRPRRAGVSSFGISGTNAHLILEEAPVPSETGQGAQDETEGEATAPLPGPLPFVLSAKSEAALKEQAQRLAAHLRANPELDPTDVAYSLATTRAAFEHRAVAIGSDREQLLEGLGALGEGAEAAGLCRGQARAQQRPAMLFGGQGSQHPGMALELLESSAAFAAHMRECERALDPHVEWSLEEVLREGEAKWLDRLDIVQPALFAVMVSLARLWGEMGVRPALVAGHSQGEIAAAHIAGGLSLDDAALVIARRAGAMAKLAGKGGMLSLSLGAEALAPRLEPFGARLALAAINGPASLVVSGEPEALVELKDACEADGVHCKPIAVDYAAHSAQIEDLREELLEAFEPISPQSGEIPMHSTVTGEPIDTAELGPEYWYRNLRQTVLLEPVFRSLLGEGQRTFIEVSPHPVLGFGLQEAIDAQPAAQGAAILATLHREHAGPERFALSHAEAHANGVAIDWEAFFAPTAAKAVALPTYAFQRERYWIAGSPGAGDAGSIGQRDPEHPLLGAMIEDPAGEGLTFTASLSLASHPWLADHAVAGTVLLPGTAFLELALHAGELAGAAAVEELTLIAPLPIPEAGAIGLQVSVGEPGPDGERPVSIHSRTEADPDEEPQWVQNASGTLLEEASAALEPLTAWPPKAAQPLDIDDLYGALADAGLQYGPAFQGLRAAWREGQDVYAEVSLAPEQSGEAAGFGIHPALLDAALHAIAALGEPASEQSLRLPFAWSGVHLLAAGASELRVAIRPDDKGGFSLAIADSSGAAIAAVGSLALRPVSAAQLAPADSGRDGLLAAEWSEASLERIEGQAAVLWELAAEPGEDQAQAARRTTASALRRIQEWLSLDQEAEEPERRLAILTQGAIASGEEESPDPALAAAWGLVRSAQAEHPGRFLLIDSDGSEASEQALARALESDGEPQLALREGVALAPRLTRLGAVADGPLAIDPERTVLITGATGVLGSVLARHLVAEHAARRLLLVGRQGPDAEGAEALRAELEGLGAAVRIVACDVSKRQQLKELLSSIPAEHPLGAVVHAAGVLDDGVIDSLDEGRIEHVFAPKADAAWHLHELTRELGLSAFVMLSSAAGVLGAPGQGNYAAANAFLDALAQERRAEGLPAASIAWGLWERRSALTAGLGEADLARMRLAGIEPLSEQHGLALFDQALAVSRSATVALGLNRAGLRSQAAAGVLPAIMSSLVRVSARRRAAAGSSLAKTLASTPAPEREALVLSMVRTEVAAVLGHASAEAIEPTRAFKDLGFDSLAAVDLRNRLQAASGLRLPATTVFDYPNPAALAAHLLDAVSADGASQQVAVRALASEEPIAIVGMACRYPGGVESPQELWELVAAGEDGISAFPTDRGWDLERLYDPDPDAPGASYAREGGFLYEATDFDPEFFGIAPREATAMDPQQRLLLEASWEALESAGIDAGSLRGSAAGVFAGMMNPDYGTRLARIPEELEGYFGVGVATSFLSGRIAYALGLEGPAMTVDTACSSSLVAMHLAAQSLRSGECNLALAGGVTVLSTPGLFIEFSRQRGLAPDGRCKSFAEGADGTGFSEGVGLLVLERLSEAQRNGHQVLATIKGSAVNQDGASNGLTAPNGPSQERVIRQALANAGLKPQDVDMVEAHGTGTTLGDPIEAGALLATYGQEREAPLKLGSIKSNIGHTQAAAGVAGVIKAVMAMREGILPKTLHAAEPSTKVEWEAGEIELLSEACPWQPNGRPRRAGVSSFGASGTNAHLILEEAPVPAEAEPGTGDGAGQGEATAPLPGPLPFVLSAKSQPALKEQAQRLAAHLRANPELDPTDVAYSLATTRAAFEHRAVAIGSDREQLLEGLGALGEGAEAAGLCRGQARAQQRPAMLFGGQGSQHPGMALELLESSAAFAAHMRECERALDPHVEWSLEEVLREGEAKWLDRLDIVQPALFAVMVSLARLWGEMGVRPALVAGHSQGEIAAAHIAGGLSLDDAALVIARRAGAMAKLAGKGGMLSLSLGAEALAPRLEPFGARLALAAINGPASLVVSGEPEALVELKEACEADGVHCKPIAVDYAAHSAQIEDLREELLEAFEPISPQSGEIPMHSTVTGEPIDTAELGPEYWYRNLRQTVLLEPVFRSLLGEGQRTFIEVSPHPVLGFGLQEAIDAQPAAQGAAILATLHREHAGPERFALSHAEAHANGVAIDWEAFFAPTAAKAVALPTYAFQRERYWIAGSPGAGDAGSIGQRDPEHPLLGAMIEDPAGEGLTFTASLSLASHPWLADHAVAGTVLLPGTAFLELALHAGELAGAAAVEELTLIAPLPIPEAGAIGLQVSVGEPGPDGERPVSIHSRTEADPDEEPQWVQNASGTLLEEASAALEPLTAWPPKAAQPLDIDDLYGALADAGLQYGPAFQGLRAAWREGQDVYAEVSLAPEQSGEAAGFGIHPALLDAALHAIAALGEPASEQSLRLPFAWSGVHLLAAGASELRIRLSAAQDGKVSLCLADGEGEPIATIGSLALRAFDPAELGRSASADPEGLFELQWSEAESLGAAAEAQLFKLDPVSAAKSSAPTRVALEAIQEWLSLDQEAEEAERRLAILTQGAIASGEEESPDPALAAAWGLVRSAQAEHPGRFLLIDSDGSEASEQALATALESDGEPQLALREGVALAPRAVPVKSEGDLLAPPSGPWRLDAPERGSLKSLALVPNPAALEPLAPNQVRVAMHAAGLNFRDVLIALGLYPGEARIGSEGAGTVLEVGSEVDDLSPGDRVMGMFDGAFGPLALGERKLLHRIPDSWSFEQGAAVPAVFLTAQYGLFDLAALQPGEKLLVHAGAGGVGMAAIGLASHLGAEVFATASPSKWDALREMGLEDDQIASSRDLEFKQKFLEVTGGEGLDVVLNSLAGEFVDASLELLPRGGRFMEMGKTDIREAEEVAFEHPGVSYRAFDLVEAGQRMGGMLAEIASLFEAGALRHAPITSWDLRRAPEAFRHLREGKNVGKVVFEVPRSIDPERTVLITGATGGLGSLVARHIVAEHGARHLLLVSRSGERAAGAMELKQELEEIGAEASIVACDVSERSQLQALLASIPEEHPLGAVIHAAGALEDTTIESLSAQSLEPVFAPKADAAWHLHELTRESELSAFVMFSSAAGVLGSPGQGNYAAANAFLDALAQERRSEGLPAASIAWGLWEREGAMTAHLGEAELERMRRSGIAALTDQEGLALFDRALGAGRPASVALGLNRAGLRSQAAAGVLPAILSGLVRSPARRRSASASSLAKTLASTPEAEREALVLSMVRTEVAAVLGHAGAEAIEPTRAFKDLGFDSLAAVELRNRLQAASGLRLPATTVFDYPNPAALAAHLLDAVSVDGASKQIAVRALASEEPIAIVGMACRYPGGASAPEQLWALLAAGRDAIGGFPEDRGWDLERLYDSDPDARGTSYAREGGFLYEAGDFDPGFFGISPREATAMDPQQRLLLEASWEALESAGIDAGSLRGSAAGVFAGISSQDYAVALQGAERGPVEGLLSTGSLPSVASGRIAYQLGLEGPAMTVDTACSSSLVAMHLAAQSLRSGECSLALAGGVTVFSTPGAFVEFSRQRGLAPDGRCKSFAEAADGTGFSEGVGLLVLERLSEAQRNGHQVLATIKGSAVNQDGASNGLTAPNGPSQERVIRQALANAGLKPQDVDMVEAHGTGTTLGDPIEAGALLATYGQEREAPLKLGSIKSNIGHTQAAAGVAGVIKAVMAMREGILPKTLHAAEPSTKVEWEAGEIELLSEACPWQPNGRPRRAGVSSFGISGTNAHLILEEAPVPSETGQGAQDETEGEATAPLPGPLPFVLSAKSEAALKEQAQRLAAHLRANPELDPTDVAYSLATTRAAFEHRAVAIGSDREQLLEGLGALGEGAEAAGLCRGQARAQQRPAMLFGGQGSQHPGMALELLESSAAFAAHMRECERALDPHVEWSLEEVLREGEAKWLDRLDIVQPALFAVMVSLARLWGEMGVRPALVAGHSQGEIAAAHIAGGLSLDDAALVIARRAGAMAKLAGKGGMLSLSLGAEALAPRLEPFGARLALAAINGPASLVVSGEPEALVELKDACEADGVHCKPIAVDYAAHSAQIEDLREELLEAFEPISPQSGEIPMHSTVTGEPIDTAELGPEYWYRNLRQTVLLEPVFRSLLGEGQRTFIEVSPHPVLGFGLQEAIDAQPAAQGAAILATLHREHAGPERFALSHAEAHANGVAIDWEAFFAPTAAKAVALPTYAFQRERYWIAGSPGAGDAGSIGQRDPEHPLLGAMIEDPAGEGLTFTASLSLASHPWLADHAVAGTVLLPGTAFLELALHAGELAGAAAVEELTLIAPLPIPEAGAIGLQVSVGEPGPDGERPVSIHSRTEADPDEEPQWVQNASGTLLEEASAALEPLTAWPPKAAQPLDIDDLYGALADAGLQYGPAFQGLRAAWREGQDVYAEVSLAPEQSGEAAGFGIHPALLDAALHAIAALGEPASEQSLRLPFAWSGVHLLAAGASELRVAIRPDDKGGFSLAIADSSGAAIAAVGSLALRPVSAAQLAPADSGRDGLLAAEWSEASLERIEGQAAVLWELAAEPGEDQAQAARRTTASALRRIQEWLSLDQEAEEPERRLAILTQGAIASGEEESPDPALAAAWGLVRSAQAEHPGRFLLIDSDGSEASEQALARALESDGEPQLALREGVALAPRLTRLGAVADGPLAIDPERTVLITGATGVLGSVLARHLVAEHAARRLLLVGRQGPDAEGAEALRAELEGLGAAVRIVACDVSKRQQLKELLSSIPAEHPLGAVVHAAGVLDDGVIDSLDEGRIEHVFAPKADAAWHLHELTRELGLSAFVMLSSAAGVLGAPGQGNYAAANAFLDALAQERRAEGLPAASIAWGLWERRSALTAGLGEADLARMRLAGIEPLSEQHGLALFDQALAVSRSATVALGLNRAGLRSQAAAGVLPAIMSSLVRVSARRRAAAGSSLAKTLASTPAPEREALVLSMVRTEVAAVLGHASAEAIEPTRAFKDLGFDSLAAVDLRNRLQAASGLRLPATTVFDYPNPAALAAHLLDAVSADGASQQVAVRALASEEPIAIVGMACRYPGGVESPQELWELVAAGEDGISAFPTDRGWDLERLYDPDPDAPGASYAREGGFLYEATDFDPEFFGIAPREATAMDPQQRLLLEASWEALESAGIDAGSLRGSAAGVFAGISSQDYAVALQGAERGLEGFLATGALSSLASGRIAYALGLEGPAMTVDTACSSSLVAMHLAAQSLRSGECNLALAGGVTVLSTPAGFIEFSRLRGLAPDGRCKSFAEGADGVGWAEGVGLLVLERLSEAQRNGHQVLATIKGSAVNQDGASNGLTAPNGPSQERVIRQALANAGLKPQDVDMVEAHGTGTTLGDPIEAGALLATYGQEREAPLKLGSVKSNIGHTQAAAGVAGVIKAVMAMREGILPKTLHAAEPSTKVEWEAGEIELLSEACPWQPNGRPRRAGVSSFGISGTNAHLILEEAPVPAEAEPGTGDGAGQGEATAPLPGPLPFVLSAKSQPALKEQAQRLAAHLRANPELDPTDVAYSLATTRAAFEHRAVAIGSDREQLLEGLGALAQGSPSPGAVSAKAASEAKLAYLLTGQGSQRVGMGKGLHETYPTYSAALDQACAELDRWGDRPLAELLFAAPASAEARLLDHTTYAQPALFATEVALYRLLESWGLHADLLCGHSIGEITAAHIAGVFDLPDAARLVAARGRLMGELPTGGAMVAIEATEAEAMETIEGKGKELAIASINGPSSVVLSGAEAAIEAAGAEWKDRGRKTKRLAVSHAFHSPLMEPMLERFEAEIAELTYNPPTIAILSNSSGEPLSPEQATDPAYWVSHVREPVRFMDGVRTLVAQGASALIELGPDPVLIAMARECLEEEGAETLAFAPALREGYEEPETLSGALAQAHATGIEVDWEAFFAGTGAKAVALPTYAFQRERYWLGGAAAAGDAGSIGLGDPDHPLLGAVIEDPLGEGAILAGRVSLQSHPWLADHAVFGATLFPGTGLLELALRAGWQVGAANVEELTLQAPLVLLGAAAAQIQVAVSGSEEDGRREVSIHSRREGEGEAGEWTCHALGVLTSLPPAAPAPVDSWPPAGAEAIEVGDLYDRFDDLGFSYGPAFQGLTAAWCDGEELYAEVSLPEELRGEARRFAIHPALADASLHALLHKLPGGGSGAEELPLPFAWRDVHVASPGAASLRLRIAPGDDGYGLTATDATGAPVAQVGAVVSRPVQRSQIEASLSGPPPLYRLRWDEIEAPAAAGASAVAILGETKIASLNGECHGDLAALIESGEAPGLVLADFRLLLRDEDLALASRAITTRALELLQAWLEAGSLEGSSLVFLTEGALCTVGGEDPDLATAALCGLVRSAQSEHPGRFALIDVDGSGASSERIGSALAATAEEPQVALREGAVLVPRLAQVQAAEGERPALLADPAATVLITGGTGGIGALLARHLVAEHGAHRLLLVSRRGPDAEGAEALRDELEALGAEVRIAACDVAEREQLKELLDSIPAEHPLGAVIHAAGVLDDGVIDSLDEGRIERVFAPKVAAAWHLHELTAAAELSAFVLFSSSAGILGGPGQGNYAAANAFLDALAQHRQARGLPANALAWGAWEPVGGMTEALASADRARLARIGLVPIRVDQGLGLFDLALADGDPLLAPVAFDRVALRAQAKAGFLPALLRGLVRLPARAESESGALVERLAALPEGEREAILLEVVCGHVATVLGHASSHQVDPDRAFKELGFDSLAAVELRNQLAVATGLRLEPTVVFDYPTATAVAAHLLRELGLGAAEEAEAPVERPGQISADVALASVEEIDAMDIGDLVSRTLDRQAKSEIGGEE